MAQIVLNGTIFILLLISQYTKEWFHYTKVSDCSWKGNFEEIYSSNCYSHKGYNDASCRSACKCCHGDDLASMTDLRGNTVCIYANFILIIIWAFLNIVINLIKIYFSFKLYWKLYCLIYIVFGIISCFLTGNSHPNKVELKTGYIFRLATVLTFYCLGMAHLFYACRLIWLGKDKVADESLSQEMISSEPLQRVPESNGPSEVTIN